MIHFKSSWMVCAILTMSSAQAVAQKSFKFTRENLLPKEMKSFVAPALLRQNLRPMTLTSLKVRSKPLACCPNR